LAGRYRGHNRTIARAIRAAQRWGGIDTVVLRAAFECVRAGHTGAEREFGVPVLTSGECGFKRVREILLNGAHSKTTRPHEPATQRERGVRGPTPLAEVAS
jgi:hypothetical protein